LFTVEPVPALLAGLCEAIRLVDERADIPQKKEIRMLPGGHYNYEGGNGKLSKPV
jgi:hypothetical protein